VTEYLLPEAVQQRKVKHSQVKKLKRIKTARQRALNTLGFFKPPNETKLSKRYHKLNGVYTRLLEALDMRQEEAIERDRLLVAEREAQLAPLAMDKNGKRMH
jgi:hypothetical protein